MRPPKEILGKTLGSAWWRAAKLSKKLKMSGPKNLTLGLLRGEAMYRRATRLLGAPHPLVAKDVVVSLTTFPLRIDKVHHVIASLLDQLVLPGKIVLYLTLDEFPTRAIPKQLLRLESDRFEIRFVAENLRPHNKLQFALGDAILP